MDQNENFFALPDNGCIIKSKKIKKKIILKLNERVEEEEAVAQQKEKLQKKYSFSNTFLYSF